MRICLIISNFACISSKQTLSFRHKSKGIALYVGFYHVKRNKMATLSACLTSVDTQPRTANPDTMTMPLIMTEAGTRQFGESGKAHIPLVGHIITDEDVGALQVCIPAL
jgi:hypothetical protein